MQRVEKEERQEGFKTDPHQHTVSTQGQESETKHICNTSNGGQPRQRRVYSDQTLFTSEEKIKQ
eukprot:2598037-Rhodomonas_salina.1